MARRTPSLELTRSQILAFRRRAGSLDERLPAGPKSFRLAAWAGLQDSVPRAALLSLHARVEGVSSSSWEHSSLVQLWGPRFSAYVVAAKDLPIFSLGRLPEDTRRRARANETASRLHACLDSRRLPVGLAAREMGVPHNILRYAAPTGTVLMRWDGARQPTIWTMPAPVMDAKQARVELARRYLHIFGPSTAPSFARWAGIGRPEAGVTFQALAGCLISVRTPIGDAWILADDLEMLRAKPIPAVPARLLPSGDAYFFAWGADREIIVPEAKLRAQLWTSRVWPGAILVNGEIAGVWRRAAAELSIELWRNLSRVEWNAVEAEGVSLPLPGPSCPISVSRGRP